MVSGQRKRPALTFCDSFRGDFKVCVPVIYALHPEGQVKVQSSPIYFLASSLVGFQVHFIHGFVPFSALVERDFGQALSSKFPDHEFARLPEAYSEAIHPKVEYHGIESNTLVPDFIG